MNWFKILFFSGAIVASVIVFRNWREKVERQDRIDSIKSVVEPFVIARSGSDSLLPDEASYFKLQFKLNKLVQDGASVDDLVSAAIEALGLTGTRGEIVKSVIMDGRNMLEKAGVLQDVALLVGLERGEAPVAPGGPFRGQRLVLSQVIPASRLK